MNEEQDDLPASEYDNSPINVAEARRDAVNGAKGLKLLRKEANHTWEIWSGVILGWRGLRDLARKQAGDFNLRSQAYRDAMSELLAQKQYAAYGDEDVIDRPTRSIMYKLCDHIEEIDQWYFGRPIGERLRWRHPLAIAKNCPLIYLGGPITPRKARTAKPKAKKGNPEAERLREILIAIIEEFVQPVNPERAAALRQSLYPTDPNDDLDGIGED